MRALNRLARCDKGTIAVEFALILPFLMTALFGGFTATRMVRASMKTWNAAQSVADLVSQQNIVLSTDITDFCKGGTLTLAPFTGTFAVTVASVTNSATNVRAVDWQDTTCGGTQISNALTLGANYTPNPSDSVIIVRAKYTYAFPASYLLPTSVTFTRYTYARPRDGTPVSHG